MAYNIVLLPIVENDIEAVVKWYEEANSDISRQFMNELEMGLRTISLNPFLFQVVYGNYRLINTVNFPYKIVYRISNDTTIIVVAVVHHKRHPRVWTDRS